MTRVPSAAPAWLLRACDTLNRTRLLPGFVHDRWDRALGGERVLLAACGEPVRPVTTGMLLGWQPPPQCWRADQ